MSEEVAAVKIGLALIMAGLLFGIGLGVSFGVNEDGVKHLIAEGIAAHAGVHDDNSADKIWRYAQRAHFHATGIAAYSLGLLAFVVLSGMTKKVKTACAILIGLGNVYPLAWFSMFLLAPSIGRDAAHHHVATEAFTYVGVAGTLAGLLLLAAHLFFGLFDNRRGD